MPLPILDGNQSATTLSTILSGGEHTPAHTVVSLGSTAISNITSAVSGSVVSISNFPGTQTIAGTVTANGGDFSATKDSEPPNKAVQIGYNNYPYGDGDSFRWVSPNDPLPVILRSSQASDNLTSATQPISGAVTANVALLNDNGSGSAVYFVTGLDVNAIRTVIYSGNDFGSDQGAPVDGTNPLPIQGTINNPSGALTTRFGSVTTANTAQITSAVTNASRKFLLVQNIATSTVTIGIGFSPTTTQGIQLAAGAGLTFDAFCPTGAVYWLSGVTGTNWSVLEG